MKAGDREKARRRYTESKRGREKETEYLKNEGKNIRRATMISLGRRRTHNDDNTDVRR